MVRIGTNQNHSYSSYLDHSPKSMIRTMAYLPIWTTSYSKYPFISLVFLPLFEKKRFTIAALTSDCNVRLWYHIIINLDT